MIQLNSHGLRVVVANLSRNPWPWPKSGRHFINTANIAGGGSEFYVYYYWMLKDGIDYIYFYGPWTTFDEAEAYWSNLNGLDNFNHLMPTRGCYYNAAIRVQLHEKRKV